jgi:hypothetical protein
LWLKEIRNLTALELVVSMPNGEGWVVGIVEMKGEEVEGSWAESVDPKGIIVEEYWTWVGRRSCL